MTEPVRIFDGPEGSSGGTWMDYDPSRAMPNSTTPGGSPPVHDHPIEGEFLEDVPFIKDAYEEVYFQ